MTPRECWQVPTKEQRCFRVARNQSRIDAERRDRFLQADLPLLIGKLFLIFRVKEPERRRGC